MAETTGLEPVEKESPKQQLSPADFINQWKLYFLTHSFGNPHLATIALHIAEGILLRNAVVYYLNECMDLRCSGMAFQTSGTGKDAFNRFVKKILKQLGYKYGERSRLSSAGLIGTVSPEGIKKYGDFYDLDLIIASEAGALFKSRNFDYNLDLFYQICRSQDYNATVSNRLANGVVEYETKASLLLCSFIIEDLQLLIVEGGLFPRFLTCIKDLNMAEIAQIRNQILDNLGKTVMQDITPLLTRLKEIQARVNWNFNFDKVRDLLKIKAKLLDEQLKALEPRFIEKLKIFINRRDLMMVKLACHHAALELREDLDEGDVEYAFNVMTEFWQQVLDFVATNLRVPLKTLNFRDMQALNMLEVGKPMLVSEYRKMLMDQFKFSVQSAQAMMNRLNDYTMRFGEHEKRMIQRVEQKHIKVGEV